MANLSLEPRQFLKALVAVFVGGVVGTLLRDVVLKVDPVPKISHVCRQQAVFSNAGIVCPYGTAPVWWIHNIPWTLLAINVLGVYIVTRLLRGALGGHDSNDLSRLFVVTGFFGGFTSYSSLFADVAPMWGSSRFGAILVLGFAVLSGVGAAWAGLRHRVRQS
jgi:fluoride ion exporter CrcB/FEX